MKMVLTFFTNSYWHPIRYTSGIQNDAHHHYFKHGNCLEMPLRWTYEICLVLWLSNECSWHRRFFLFFCKFSVIRSNLVLQNQRKHLKSEILPQNIFQSTLTQVSRGQNISMLVHDCSKSGNFRGVDIFVHFAQHNNSAKIKTRENISLHFAQW